MYRIGKTFTFAAAHSLPELHDGHKCRQLHGHTYRVEVVLLSEMLNSVGFVKDFGEMTELKVYIDQRLDHCVLNKAMKEHPTAENIARHIFDWCQARWRNVDRVRVWESDTSWAEYSRQVVS